MTPAATLWVCSAAPVVFWTLPKSANVNLLPGAKLVVLVSLVSPVTAIPYSLPLFNPALSMSVPVLVLSPM